MSLLRLLVLAFGVMEGRAQDDSPKVITTFAGTDWVFQDAGKRAVHARLGHLGAVASDATGNVYIADGDHHRVFRVRPDGVIELWAGNGIPGFSGDGGPALNSSLYGPAGIAADNAGNLYIADQGNNRIRVVSARGVITTVAGSGRRPAPNARELDEEGIPAADARLNNPTSVAVDPNLNLYFSDADNRRIRRVDARTRQISTVAGNGTDEDSGGSGPATQFGMRFPVGVAVGPDGSIYFSDPLNNRIRKVTNPGPAGTISTVAGTGTAGYSPDESAAAAAPINRPWGITLDPSGNLYFSDSLNGLVRKISNGILSTVAGNRRVEFSGDSGPSAELSVGIANDLHYSTGSLYIGDSYNSRIWKVTLAESQAAVFAGNALFRVVTNSTGDPVADPIASDAYFFGPEGMRFDASGNLYVADTRNNRIRKITREGRVLNMAGTGAFECGGDGGAAGQALIGFPRDVEFDGDGNLYIADAKNARIRKVDLATGVITTVVYGQAPACEPRITGPLVDPSGIAFRGDMLLVADGAGDVIRSFRRDGSGGRDFLEGLKNPQSVAVHQPSGDIYVADTGNNRILRVTTIRESAAEQEFSVFASDIKAPQKIAVDRDGNVYVAEAGTHKVVRINPRGVVALVAGNGRTEFSGDGGLAELASLHSPSGIAVGQDGRIYVADTGHDRIRVVSTAIGALSAPTPSELSLAMIPGDVLSATRTVRLEVADRGRNLPLNLPYIVATSAPWIQVSSRVGITPAQVDVRVNPSSLAIGTHSGAIVFTVPGAAPLTRTVPISVVISGGLVPGNLSVDRPLIALQSIGTTSVVTNLQIFYAGRGSTRVDVSVIGDRWLQVSPSGRSVVSEGSPVRLTVTASTSFLTNTTGTAQVRITTTDNPPFVISVPVTLTKSNAQPLRLSAAAMSFVAVAGGAKTLPQQSFSILGSESWNPPKPSVNWLTTTVSGRRVRVAANPQGKAPGTYYGQIEVSTSGATQFVTVMLVVEEADAGPQGFPAALVFREREGSASSGSKTFEIFNLGRENYKIAYSLTQFDKFIETPKFADIVEPDVPQSVTVQTQPLGLPPGRYEGTLNFDLQGRSSGRYFRRQVAIVLLIERAAAGSAAYELSTGDCSPGQLKPILEYVGGGNRTLAGLPTVVTAQVPPDPAGCPLQSGLVTAKLAIERESELVSLVSLGDGYWEGVWIPAAQNRYQSTVEAQADPASQKYLSSETQVEVGPAPRRRLTIASVVSHASRQTGPIAPGSLISVQGAGLGPEDSRPRTWDSSAWRNVTTVRLGGRDLPVWYASTSQIDVMVPFDIAIGSSPQLFVVRDTGLTTVPFDAGAGIAVVSARPAIYAADIRRENGQAIDDTGAAKGERIHLRCAGLGDVSPRIQAGVAPPAASQLPRVILPVTVSIGERDMPLAAEPTLWPGEPGVYRVTVTVPDNISSGPQNLTITVDGQTSPPVPLRIQ